MPNVNNIHDLKKDIAGTHKILKTKRDIDPDSVEQDWQQLQDQGFILLPTSLAPRVARASRPY